MTDTGNGFRLGVLMLDNGFPRPVGDIGNADTFPFDVIYDKVPGARVEKIVTGYGLAPDLVAEFSTRARRLEAEGCTMITTGCGFMLAHQRELSEAVGVPFVASSLCLLPYLQSIRPAAKPIGVLTYDGPKLVSTLGEETARELEIVGIETGTELHAVIAEDRDQLNFEAARQDVRQAAETLKAKAPDPFAVVMECTNLPPYRDAVEETFDCPIYDIRDLVHWHAGLARPS